MERYEVMLGHKMGWHWFNTGVLMLLLIVFAAVNCGTGIYTCIHVLGYFPVSMIAAFISYGVMIVLAAVAREHSYKFEPKTWYLILAFYAWNIINDPVSAWGNGSSTGVIIGALIVGIIVFIFNVVYYMKRKELFFDIEYVDE